MGEASSTSTLRTLIPSGGVWGVLSIMPRICRAEASAPAASSASLTPPPLPRPPACTCALTTTLPPRLAAMARACSGVSATSPLGTATPYSLRMALPWYSWIFTGSGFAGDLPGEPDDRVVLLRHQPFLEGNDGVVGDVDVLGAHFGAALGDVAVAEPGLGLRKLQAVVGVERMHLELGDAHEEAGPREAALVLRMIADDVAHVLAKEALDALAELLAPLHVFLLHPSRPVRLLGPRLEGRHLLGTLEVEGDIRGEVAIQGEGLDGRHRHRLARIEGIHAGHAHEARLAVDLRAARAALARLAVPAAGEVARLGRLDGVNHVEDDHALLHGHAVVLEGAALGVAAPHAHVHVGAGGHHLRSWRSALSSGGGSGSGSCFTVNCPPCRRSTTLTLLKWSSAKG